MTTHPTPGPTPDIDLVRDLDHVHDHDHEGCFILDGPHQQAADSLLARLADTPDWVLGETDTFETAFARLWTGWMPVHAVAFFGLDRATLYTDGTRWAVAVYWPENIPVASTPDALTCCWECPVPDARPWHLLSLAQRRSVMSDVASRVLCAQTLRDLLALVATEFEYLDEYELSDGMAQEAAVVVLAEWLAHLGEDVEAFDFESADLLAHVVALQTQGSEDVASEREFIRMSGPEALLGLPYEQTMAYATRGPVERPAPNAWFTPGGCETHSYPLR